MAHGMQAGQMFVLQVGEYVPERPLGVHLKRTVTLQELQALKAEALAAATAKHAQAPSDELVRRELVGLLIGRNYAYVQALNHYVI